MAGCNPTRLIPDLRTANKRRRLQSNAVSDWLSATLEPALMV